MGILVICSYKPKPGHEADVEALMARHVAALQGEGLATACAPLQMKAADGTYLEIFEWVSEDAARAAEGNAVVGEIWGAFAKVCDFVPLKSLPETATPFAHFTPV